MSVIGKKLHCDIQVRRSNRFELVYQPDDLVAAADVIYLHSRALGRPVVVNIAGNSEQTSPGIGLVEAIVENPRHDPFRRVRFTDDPLPEAATMRAAFPDLVTELRSVSS